MFAKFLCLERCCTQIVYISKCCRNTFSNKLYLQCGLRYRREKAFQNCILTCSHFPDYELPLIMSGSLLRGLRCMLTFDNEAIETKDQLAVGPATVVEVIKVLGWARSGRKQRRNCVHKRARVLTFVYIRLTQYNTIFSFLR